MFQHARVLWVARVGRVWVACAVCGCGSLSRLNKARLAKEAEWIGQHACVICGQARNGGGLLALAPPLFRLQLLHVQLAAHTLRCGARLLGVRAGRLARSARGCALRLLVVQHGAKGVGQREHRTGQRHRLVRVLRCAVEALGERLRSRPADASCRLSALEWVRLPTPCIPHAARGTRDGRA